MAENHFIRIAITPPYFYEGESRYICKLLEQGAYDYVHIRKPDCDESQLITLISAIKPGLHDRLTLHSHFHIAERYGIGGIHLNSRATCAPSSWQGRISISLHSIEECRQAVGYTYVTLSPIFPSISKPGYQPDFDKHELESLLRNQTRVPVIALGGITHSRIDIINQYGFDGVAMLTDAWRHPLNLSAFCLQFITNPTTIEHAVSQCGQVLAGGCKWIQLRWKDATDQQIISAGKIISGLCRDHGATFIIDDRVDLVHECCADGVHLGKNDMAIDEARKILSPGRIIGGTANTPDDIINAAKAGADYIGYGPYRFTTTKKNLSPILGLEGYIRAIRFMRDNGVSLPVVAIGGINRSDIPGIMATGVTGIAMSGTIINSTDSSAVTADIIQIINQSKSTINE